MTKAFAYLRVSGKGQVDGDGFTRQLVAIKTYAKAHNLQIVRVFREEGVPGATELENRPAFVEMMTALHSNGTRLVLIEKLDRLARKRPGQGGAVDRRGESSSGDLRHRIDRPRRIDSELIRHAGFWCHAQNAKIIYGKSTTTEVGRQREVLTVDGRRLRCSRL